MTEKYVYAKFSYLTGNQKAVYYVKHLPIKEKVDGIWATAYAVVADPKRPGSGSEKWINGGYFGFYDMRMYRIITKRSLPKHLREVKQKGVA